MPVNRLHTDRHIYSANSHKQHLLLHAGQQVEEGAQTPPEPFKVLQHVAYFHQAEQAFSSAEDAYTQQGGLGTSHMTAVHVHDGIQTTHWHYNPPRTLDTEGTAAVPGLGGSPAVLPRVPAIPIAEPAGIPRGLTAVMGLSSIGNMAALLPAVETMLAGNAMLPPRDKLGLAGMAEVLLLPAMSMKEGKTALLPGLDDTMLEPLRELGESVSLQTCFTITPLPLPVHVCAE